MASDDDLIFVDIVPRLDESETERATGKLRDKFKNAGKGIGKVIGSDVTREIGEMVWDAGGEDIKAAGVRWGKTLTKGLGDAIGGTMGDIAKNLGDSLLEGAADTVGDRIKSHLKGAKDAAEDLKKSFADIKDGKFDDVLKRIDDNAEKLPDPLKKVHEQTKPISDAFNDIKGTGKDVIDIFAGLEILSPRLASGLAAVATPLGEIAGSMAMVPKIDDWLKQLPGVGDWMNQHLPDPSNWNWLMAPLRMAGGDIMHPSRLGHDHLYDPKTGNYIGPGATAASPPTPPAPGPSQLAPATPPGYTTAPGSLDPFSALMPPGMAAPSGGMPSIAPPDTGGGAHTSGFTSGGIHATLADYTTPSLPNVTSPQDLTTAGGGVANLYRVAESLQGTPYSQKIRNDCSGMVSQLASAALGLPAPGPGERFSTVNEGQWLASHGFQMGTPPPGVANSSLQIGWYDHGGGNLGHTAATLPGGVNAESGGSVGSFSLGGGVGANSPQFEHHAFLPMGMGMPGAPMAGGPGGARVSPTGFGTGPGMPGLPGLVAPPTQGNTYSPQPQQSIGHGSGIGVTGGGALGLAEQAGAMAAGAFSFGGGAIAAQIAEQEMNLAIQKGGQMAATGIMAIPETFMLSGGQMGAPSVGSGGWIRKIVGGMMGQQFNSPNIAGGSQPAKQPKQKEGEGEGDDKDPLKGDKPKGGPNGGGPSGHKDDPIHVQQVGPPQGQPQGQATSAMNAAGVMSAVSA